MTVLVTGATGFIGRAVLGELAARGVPARAVSRHAGIAGPWRETAVLPEPTASPEAFQELMSGISHVIHCAALNNDSADAPESNFHTYNAVLTEQLAKAAANVTDGRFIYLSSTRAVVRAGVDATIGAESPARPSCAYGRSKREGEIRALEAYAHRPGSAAVLRAPPVYGPGMKGNLAALLRLADTAMPLPLAGMKGRRSLISRESLVRAILHLIFMPAPLHPVYVAGDAEPMSTADIVGAYRRGLKRPRRLFALPPAVMASVAMLAGKSELWRALAATQLCNPAFLVGTGWRPEPDTPERLAELARSIRKPPGRE